ncbi:hypothetical protein SLE2022_393630 [Rubroshorea leprosula]
MGFHSHSAFSAFSSFVPFTSLASFTLGCPLLGFIKQKHEQQGHWNKNFITFPLLSYFPQSVLKLKCIERKGSFTLAIPFYLISHRIPLQSFAIEKMLPNNANVAPGGAIHRQKDKANFSQILNRLFLWVNFTTNRLERKCSF